MNTGEDHSVNKGNRFHRYLQYASAILLKYKGGEPFHLYLKKYFSANKKHGSKDRKQITSLCYHYFRLGFGVKNEMSIEEKLFLATFLLENKSSAILNSLKPEWNEKIYLNISSKLEMVKEVFGIDKIFPFGAAKIIYKNKERF
jgi:16S rRNA (cytosine967-C5)-methyltransferase